MGEGGRTALLVALGGGLGAVARYLVSLWLTPWSGGVPLNYLFINTTGSVLIGMILVLTLEAGMLSDRWRMFLAVGILGGYTTFSTYAYGVFHLAAHGHFGAAYFYALGSLLFGLLGTYLGMVATRTLWRAARLRAEEREIPAAEEEPSEV